MVMNEPGPDGRGYIFLNNRHRYSFQNDIDFLVDGVERLGYLGIVVFDGSDAPEINDKGEIWFCTRHVLERSSYQCASIPDAAKNFDLFQKIVTADRGIVICFHNEHGYINGLGTASYADHENKDYNNKWLFWENGGD